MPEEKEKDEGTLTVLLALFANLGVGLLKLAAGLISGSGALLSEAAHSAGDSTTEVLLLVAQRRSRKPADSSHPFGYGKERYFWSMLAAVAIFVSGAGFSIYEGVTTIFGGGGAEQAVVDQLPGAGCSRPSSRASRCARQPARCAGKRRAPGARSAPTCARRATPR